MKRNRLLFLVIILLPFFSLAQSTVYPKNNQVLSDTVVTIQWDEFPNALSYHLQISTDKLFQSIIIDSNNIVSEEICVNLNYGVYYSRLKSNTSLYTPINKFTVFSPKVIDSLVLWLSADTGVVAGANNKVSQWNDLSGHNHNAVQGSSTKQPLYRDSIIGNNPSVSFIGGSTIISGTYSDEKPNNKNRSLFLLLDNQYSGGYNNAFVNFNTGLSYKYLELSYYSSKIRCWIGNGLSYDLKTLNGSFSDTKLSSIVINNSTIDAYLNGIKSSSENSSYYVDSIINFAIGGRTSNGTNISQPFNGQVFEIIDYAKPLDSIEIQTVNKYLLDKYTPPINLGQNIKRKYGFSDTIIATDELYSNYSWSNGDTIRSLDLSIEDTGWFWCDVPNLFGEIMRDSVYVYGFKTGVTDTLICFNDTISVILPPYFQPLGEISQNPRYTFEWKNTLNQTISVDSFIQIYEEGMYYLKITDTLNYSFYDTMFVKVDSFPIEASLGPNQSLCTGDKIGLVSGQAQADSFLWNTGSTDSLIIINTAGIYSLITKDALGCIAKDTISVDIHGVTPMVDFYADTVCFRDSSIFIDQSQSLDQSNLISWTWEFGDGNSLQSPVGSQQYHLLPDSGTYTAKLTVATDSNCANYAYKNVYVRPLPEPDFFPLTGCQNHEITFNNLTVHTDSIVSFHWNFGDGASVIGNQLSVISSNQESMFNLESSTLNQELGTPNTEQGTTNNEPGTTHIYTQSGQYNTKLTATDIHGCIDSIYKTVTINPSPNSEFNYSTTCEGEEISFADNSSSESYLPINEWKWRFSENDSSDVINPIFDFDTAGFYPVQLYVKTINGCWDTITKSVQLHAKPEANFSHDSACAGSYVSFQDLSTIQDGSINYYYWLSDGIAFSAQQNPEHIFNDTLNHEVVLRVRTTALCEDSITINVKSHPLPKAVFSTDKEYGLPPLTVNFSNQSSVISNQWAVNSKKSVVGSNLELSTLNNEPTSTPSTPSTFFQPSTLTYFWTFGDEITSTLENPIHTYTDSAIFYPQLLVTNIFGCKDSTKGVIYAVYSAVDVEVSDVKSEIKNGYISYSCKISNKGKQKLTKLELKARYNAGMEISEEWNGTLASGESMIYNFVGKAQVPSGEQVRYFCISAEVTQITDQEDERPSNNSSCRDISNDYWLSGIYPNPAVDNIQFDIIIPFSQNIDIQIIDISGKIIITESISGQKGLNQITLPIHHLPQSQFSLRVITKDKTEVRNFLK